MSDRGGTPNLRCRHRHRCEVAAAASKRGIRSWPGVDVFPAYGSEEALKNQTRSMSGDAGENPCLYGVQAKKEPASNERDGGAARGDQSILPFGQKD